MSLEHGPQRQVTTGAGHDRSPIGSPCLALAFTVSEFCAAHRISRSWLYKAWRAGRGPRIKRVGKKIIITSEAAADWRHEDAEDGPR